MRTSKKYNEQRIEAFLRWCSEHPTLDISRYKRSKTIMAQGPSFDTLNDEFWKMKKIYDYLIQKINKGTVSEDLFRRCKEANVKGPFGYPSNVEEMAKKYRITLEQANQILAGYDSLESFLSACKQWGVNAQDINGIQGVRDLLDLDFNPNSNFDILLRDILDKCHVSNNIRPAIYHSSKLLENVMSLAPQERDAILYYYKLNDDTPMTYSDIGKKLNITGERVRQLVDSGLRMLGTILMLKQLISSPLNQLLKWDSTGFSVRENLNAEEMKYLNELRDIIFSSNCIIYPDIEFAQEGYDIDLTRLDDLMFNLSQSDKPKENINLDIEIKELGFPTIARLALNRVGVYTLRDLMRHQPNDLRKLHGIGPKILDIILSQVFSVKSLLGIDLIWGMADKNTDEDLIKYKDTILNSAIIEDYKSNEILYQTVAKIGLSVRAVNALGRNNIHQVFQLISYSTEELRVMSGIGRIVCAEVEKAIKSLCKEYPEVLKARLEAVPVDIREREGMELVICGLENDRNGEITFPPIHTISLSEPSKMEDFIIIPTIYQSELGMLTRRKRKLTEKAGQFYKKVKEGERLVRLVDQKNTSELDTRKND